MNMAKGSERDLATMLGDPRKAIAAMTLPMLVSYVVMEVNLFVDTFWTSGLGPEASSAISTVAPLYAIFGAFGVGLGVAASATISFRLGKGDKEGASALAGNTMALGILVSIAVSAAVFLLMGPLMDFMGADDIADLGREYIMPFVLTSWALILHSIVAGILRAEGGGRRSMAVLVTSAVVNMALDPILIYVLGLGLTGAAAATSISAMAATAVGLSWYRSGKMNLRLTRKCFVLTKERIMDIVGVFVPRTTESLINNMIIIVQRVFVIACAGTIGVMYFNMPWRFVMLGCIPAQAIGASMIPVCSSALGQGRPDKMTEGVRYSAKLTLLISLALSALIIVFADQMVSAFTYNESMAEHKETLAWVLRLYGFALTPFALTSLGSSVLQALRRSKMATGVTFVWAFVKLAAVYVASLYSFEAVIYALVLCHYVILAMMAAVVHREIKMKKNSASPTPI